MSERRVILMLHGPTSRFWRELGAGFEVAGHTVVKVNFSMGEAVFWRRLDAINYRGRLKSWRPFLNRLIETRGITDILYYADRFPYHVIAGQVARTRGIRALALENGYLRPDWLTLERGGMGVYSHVPKDPAIIRAIAQDAPEPDLTTRFRHGFWTEMVSETTYHWINEFWRIPYPFFQSGKHYNPILEVLAGIPHLLRQKQLGIVADAIIDARVQGNNPYFVVPLQLQGDYQIRDNSPFADIGAMIRDVLTSFAAHAPSHAEIVFKQHPHDNNWENFSRRVRMEALRLGIADRVFFIDGGDLGRLLAKAAGTVMINSTVGLFSIRAGCPTKILGVAVYDMPGLTHQGALDGFWDSPQPVDPSLAEAFVRAIARIIQVKGSFYDPAGRKAAIDTIVARVIARSVNQPGGFVDPPPRLATARALGMEVG